MKPVPHRMKLNLRSVRPAQRCQSIRCSTSSFEETSGLETWGSLFIALQLPLWGASGNHSATLIERSRGQTFLFGLSLSFCLMNKSTFLHTRLPLLPPHPCKSKLWVQLSGCYWLNIFRDDARTVFFCQQRADHRWKMYFKSISSTI